MRRPGPRTGTSAGTVALAIRSGVLGAFATLLFNLLVLPFVLAQLGPDLYGVWIAVSALIAVGSLADAGIRTEVVRRVAGARGSHDEEGLVRAVHVGTTVMILTVAPVVLLGVVFAPALATLVLPGGVSGYGSNEIVWVLRIMLVAMAANLVLGAHFAGLRGVQRTDVETVALVAGLPVHALVLILGIRSGWGLWALLAAQLAGMAVALLIQGLGSRRLLPTLRLRLGTAPWRTVLSYLSLSALALLSQVGDVFDSQWDKLIIARFVDAESVTSLHIGTMLVLQTKMLALLPLAPLLAGVAEFRVRRPEEAQQLQRRLMKAGAVASAVALGGMFVFAPAFIALWLGPGYEEAGVVARIFAIAVALNLFAAPVAYQAFAEGLHRMAAVAATANILVNAAASFVLTLRVGLYGAVIGSVIANLVATLVLLVLARRRLQTWVRPPLLAPLLAVILVTFIVLAGLDDITSWPLLAVAVGCFVLVVGGAGSRLEGLSMGAVLTVLGRQSR